MELKTVNEDFGLGLATRHVAGLEDKPRISFLGANGHAASTYAFFFEHLTKNYCVEAMECRAAWPGAVAPSGSIYWSDLAKDYAAFLKSRKFGDQSLIHVGHSLGGSLGIMQAIEQPELFRALVVIDPGTVPSLWHRQFIQCLPLRLRKKIPLIRGTLERRSEFQSKEQFIESMRKKRTYAKFCDEAMRDYADGGLVRSGESYRLKYSGVWEGTIFCDTPHIWPSLLKVQVPTLMLRAENTYLQSRASFERLARRCQQANTYVTLQELPGVSHMAIQENPRLVSGAVLSWLQSVGV